MPWVAISVLKQLLNPLRAASEHYEEDSCDGTWFSWDAYHCREIDFKGLLAAFWLLSHSVLHPILFFISMF